MRRHIAILDPAVKTPETDCFNHLASLSPLPLTYHLPKLSGMASLLDTAGNPAGIIVLGSASSVNDGESWQRAMNTWLLPKIQAGVPTLGLCYGHQLIAHLFGGRVDFMYPDKKKLTGFRTVALKANRLWGGKSLEGPLAVTHQEAVVEIPKGFEVMGSTREVAVEALSHPSLPVWGLQAHPEATPSFLKTYGIAQPETSTKLDFGHMLVTLFFDFVRLQ